MPPTSRGSLIDHEHARMLLTHIRETFLVDGNPFDAALADLDLAISYMEEGRTAEIQDLAEEMVTVFRNLDISDRPWPPSSSFRNPPAVKSPPPPSPETSPRPLPGTAVR